jgi:hypothetical protein
MRITAATYRKAQAPIKAGWMVDVILKKPVGARA